MIAPVGDPDAVVDLVALLQPAKDRDRVGDVGLGDVDRLESPLQGRVPLDVAAVLVRRGGADADDLASRRAGFRMFAASSRPVRVASADDRVQLVQENDDRALGGRTSSPSSRSSNWPR